jgi:hypothetical protein
LPIAIAGPSAHSEAGAGSRSQAGGLQLWIPEPDECTHFKEGDEREFAALLSEIRGESGAGLGTFLLFFQRAGALARFKNILLATASTFPLTGECAGSGISWSIVSRLVDQFGEYHFVEGRFISSTRFEPLLDVAELASDEGTLVKPQVLFKERRDTASEHRVEDRPGRGEVAFCALWRALPSDSDRVWMLQLTLNDGGRPIEIPIACTFDPCNDRDISRDVVKTLLDEWRIDEPAGWKLAEFISGCRNNRFRNRVVRTEIFRFGLDRPAKRSIVAYFGRMTTLASVNMFMSEFVASSAQDTELVILVVGKQAWSDLFEHCLSKIEGVCQNPIRVIYSQGSIPAAMALTGIVKSLKSEAVLLLPADFSWPAFDHLFGALEGSNGILLLDPVPDWCAREVPLTQRSALESFIFSQRSLLGRQRRRPVLAERRKLAVILSKLPVFLRDEMFYEELGRFLEDCGAATLEALGCFQVEMPARLPRVETVVNQLIALQHRRSTRGGSADSC